MGTLALLNSAINPVLYGCFNVQLKRSLAELCCPGTMTSPTTHRPMATSPSFNGTAFRAGRERVTLSRVPGHRTERKERSLPSAPSSRTTVLSSRCSVVVVS